VQGARIRQAILIWSGAVIWAAWRAAWITGAIAGVALVIGLLVGSEKLSGPQPVAYGITLGASLFFGGAMVVMGVIAHVVRALARGERG
jgi:hypothetical protein